MHGLIMGTVTIQYVKSKHLNSISDCSPFCTPLNPNHQLHLWNIYEIMTTSCYFTTVTLGQARITSHWIAVMVSPLISLLLSPSSLFSTHRQSKLLKMFISSSHSSNNNQLPITLRIKCKWPHFAFLSNFISLLPPVTLSPPISFTFAGFLAVPGTSHTQCLFWVFTFTSPSP